MNFGEFYLSLPPVLVYITDKLKFEKKKKRLSYKYHLHHKKVCSREKWKNGSNSQVLTGVQNVHVHVYLYNKKIIAIMNQNIRYVSFFVLKLIM